MDTTEPTPVDPGVVRAAIGIAGVLPPDSDARGWERRQRAAR